MGGLSYARAVIFGRLNDVFRGKPLAPNGDPAATERVVEVVRRYGGAEGARKPDKPRQSWT